MIIHVYNYTVIFVIKHTRNKFLENEIEKLHLEGLGFSWWIFLSAPRALSPLGSAGPDGRARSAVLSQGTAGIAAARHGRELSRLDLISLLWATKSDVKRTSV